MRDLVEYIAKALRSWARKTWPMPPLVNERTMR